MDMVKIARKQSSKIDLAGIYCQTKLTFSIILKHKVGNKQMYHILYFAIHFQTIRTKQPLLASTIHYNKIQLSWFKSIHSCSNQLNCIVGKKM